MRDDQCCTKMSNYFVRILHQALLLFMNFIICFHPDLVVHLALFLDIVRGTALHRPAKILPEYCREFREMMSFSDADENAHFFKDATLTSDGAQALPVSIAVSKKRKASVPPT